MSTVYDLSEQLRYEYADIMLAALRKEAGVFLSTDEWYKAREKLAEVLRIELSIR